MRSQLWLLPCSLAFALSVVLHVVWLRELDRECEVVMRSSPTIITVPVLVTPAKLEPPWCPRGGLYFASRAGLLEALGGGHKGPGFRAALFGSHRLPGSGSIRSIDGRSITDHDDLAQVLRAKVPFQLQLDVEIERNGVTCRRTIWLD